MCLALPLLSIGLPPLLHVRPFLQNTCNGGHVLVHHLLGLTFGGIPSVIHVGERCDNGEDGVIIVDGETVAVDGHSWHERMVRISYGVEVLQGETGSVEEE